MRRQSSSLALPDRQEVRCISITRSTASENVGTRSLSDCGWRPYLWALRYTFTFQSKQEDAE